MDIETLARKLEPLRPNDVKHWMRVRETADTQLREMIERQIIETAHDVLGDFSNKTLLSLPPKSVAKGAIQLGTVLYEQPKWSAGLEPSEVLQNVAIFGRSGAGKTNVAFHLLRQFTNSGVPWLFLDWKRTARHLLPHLKRKINVFTPGRSLAPMAFNPFIVPPGMEPNVYVNLVADTLAEALTLGDGARSVFRRALVGCYESGETTPTVREVIDRIDAIPSTERVRGWKISALRALESLAFANVTAVSSSSQEKHARTLREESTIVELDALSQGGKRFLIPMLALWLYHVKLASPQRERLSLVIIVEEAHHVLYRQERNNSESVMNMLLRQCREIGIAMIVVDQHPHLISSAALGNCYTSICLNLKDPADIRSAAGLSQVLDADKGCFSALPVGQGVVKLQDRWRMPFLVKFPRVDVNKGAVTDDLLRSFLAGKSTLSAAKRVNNVDFTETGRFRLEDYPLGHEELRFLGDVIDHVDDGVDARYKRLVVSADRGNRLKKTLVSRGWLEEQVVNMGRTRRVLLRLTPLARNSLGLMQAEAHRGSLAHEYWKRFYARLFAERGYDVMLEAPRIAGRVDVLATKNGERVAIEIETGKSDVVANVKQCLRAGFAKVLVVAVDGSALTAIERQLARSGLIIRGRVFIVSTVQNAQSFELPF